PRTVAGGPVAARQPGLRQADERARRGDDQDHHQGDTHEAAHRIHADARARRSSSARNTTIRNRTPPATATRPPRPINPIPNTSCVLLSTCSPPATLRCTP